METPYLKDPGLRYCSNRFLFIFFFLQFLLPLEGYKADAAQVENKTSQSAQAPAVSSSKSKEPVKSETVPAKSKYFAGEDPEFARQNGWPVKHLPLLPGSILSNKRIIAYYGNPLSKRMGVLGQYPKEEMMRRLQKEVDGWEKADPSRPVQPALHLIAVVAQGEPGRAEKYRMVMPDKIINQVYDWAKEANAIMFLDIQTGHDDIQTLLPGFEWILKNPDVHLAIDPEFNLGKSKKKPGTLIGTYDAEEINFVSDYLQNIVKKYHLPPKVLVVHRFTRNMVTNASQIELHPEVEIVINMDGWGAPYLKRDSYRDFIVKEPVQFTGLKLFYHNDTKKGHPLLTPKEVLRLNPVPVYIQYQ